jgi:hypothetical protein
MFFMSKQRHCNGSIWSSYEFSMIYTNSSTYFVLKIYFYLFYLVFEFSGLDLNFW